MTPRQKIHLAAALVFIQLSVTYGQFPGVLVLLVAIAFNLRAAFTDHEHRDPE